MKTVTTWDLLLYILVICGVLNHRSCISYECRYNSYSFVTLTVLPPTSKRIAPHTTHGSALRATPEVLKQTSLALPLSLRASSTFGVVSIPPHFLHFFGSASVSVDLKSLCTIISKSKVEENQKRYEMEGTKLVKGTKLSCLQYRSIRSRKSVKIKVTLPRSMLSSAFALEHNVVRGIFSAFSEIAGWTDHLR